MSVSLLWLHSTQRSESTTVTDSLLLLLLICILGKKMFSLYIDHYKRSCDPPAVHVHRVWTAKQNKQLFMLLRFSHFYRAAANLTLHPFISLKIFYFLMLFSLAACSFPHLLISSPYSVFLWAIRVLQYVLNHAITSWKVNLSDQSDYLLVSRGRWGLVIRVFVYDVRTTWVLPAVVWLEKWVGSWLRWEVLGLRQAATALCIRSMTPQA